MSATVAALAAVGGGLGALVWEPLEPRLIARSEGTGELIEQPPWTRKATSRPIVMLVSAIACGAAGLRFGATRELIPALVLAFALVGISSIDLRYRIIPDRITLPLAVAGLVLAAVLRPSDLPELLLSAFGAGLFLLVAALLSPSGMGIGDVKLAFVLGLFVGQLGRDRDHHRPGRPGRADAPAAAPLRHARTQAAPRARAVSRARRNGRAARRRRHHLLVHGRVNAIPRAAAVPR